MIYLLFESKTITIINDTIFDYCNTVLKVNSLF